MSGRNISYEMDDVQFSGTVLAREHDFQNNWLKLYKSCTKPHNLYLCFMTKTHVTHVILLAQYILASWVFFSDLAFVPTLGCFQNSPGCHYRVHQILKTLPQSSWLQHCTSSTPIVMNIHNLTLCGSWCGSPCV